AAPRGRGSRPKLRRIGISCLCSSFLNRTAALRPLRQPASRPATSPVVSAAVEERDGRASLLPREAGEGDRPPQAGGGGGARPRQRRVPRRLRATTHLCTSVGPS